MGTLFRTTSPAATPQIAAVVPPPERGSRLQRFARSPVTGGFTTILIVLAGLLGSIYTSEIKVHPLFAPLRQFGAASFVVVAMMAAVLFFMERSAARSAARVARRELLDATDKLLRETDDLKQLVRTVPPADFLVLFEQIYTRLSVLTQATAQANSDPRQIDTLDASIRTVLAGIGALARKFDLRTPGASRAVYGISVMVFRPADDGTAWRELAARCSQLEPGMRTDSATLTGLLQYEPRLSTTTTSTSSEGEEPPAPDPTLMDECLILPVPTAPMRKDKAGRSRVLPGAPLSLVDGKPKLYSSVAAFFADLDERCGFSADVRKQAQEYFERYEEHIRSFLCLPLLRKDGNGGDYADSKHHRFAGVLNIHRNQPSLLGEQELAEQFAILALPFLTMLIVLLDKRQTMEAAVGAVAVAAD